MTWVSVCLYPHLGSRFSIYGVLVLTGKTIQVIAFLTAIMNKRADKRDKNRRGRRAKELAFRGHDMKNGSWPKANAEWPTCLIITPPTLLDNWQRELRTVSSF
jgi:SNF2 family DNA or RNA helicase